MYLLSKASRIHSNGLKMIFDSGVPEKNLKLLESIFRLRLKRHCNTLVCCVAGVRLLSPQLMRRTYVPKHECRP